MITVKLFKNGQYQAIRNRKDFEFKGINEVSIRKEGMIAGHALSIEAVLVTNNQKYFSKVPK